MKKTCMEFEALHVAPGWGCCACRTYNGSSRNECKHCGHARCDPLKGLAERVEQKRRESEVQT